MGLKIVERRKGRGGKRAGAGRPKGTPNRGEASTGMSESVWLSDELADYLATYHPGNRTQQLEEALRMLKKFKPRGPRTNPAMTEEQLERHGVMEGESREEQRARLAAKKAAKKKTPPAAPAVRVA
jgi:hypothetical protein